MPDVVRVSLRACMQGAQAEIAYSEKNLVELGYLRAARGTPAFFNLELQPDNGDLLPTKASLHDAHLARQPHWRLALAGSLVAKHKRFLIDKKPMPIPVTGEPIDTTTYNKALAILKLRKLELEKAQQHFTEKLGNAELTDAKRLEQTNKLKQVQQFHAGCEYLLQQYLHLQRNTQQTFVLTDRANEALERHAMNASDKMCHILMDPSEVHQRLWESLAADTTELSLKLLKHSDININYADASGMTFVEHASLSGNLSVLKKLLSRGAILKDGTRINLIKHAIKHRKYGIARYLRDFANKKNKKIEHDELVQGPSEKNLALKHVEYVLHCLVGIEYMPSSGEEAIYAKAADLKNDGKPFAFRLEKDAHNHIIAHCPNGACYNVSLALSEANLECFILTSSDHDAAIIKKCEELLGRSVEAKQSMHLRDGRTLPIYDAEEYAIHDYTGDNYTNINALLRGIPSTQPIDAIKKNFILSLLAISGTNKNIVNPAAAADGALEEKGVASTVLTRREAKLPEAMLRQMMLPNQLIHRAGMLSFSKSDHIMEGSNKLTMPASDLRQASISSISHMSEEEEVLFSPGYLRFVEFSGSAQARHFKTQRVHGVATEYHNNYVIRLAVEKAYSILKQPYKRIADPRFGINRHNHALAHHIRACYCVEPVIDYFKHHAKDTKFRKFCEQLSPQRLMFIKLLMIFSKTGRESEASPYEIEAYMAYQRASQDNLRRFMRNTLHCDEATIEYYAEIMLHMGNPAYPELVTGDTEEELQQKQFINHITALAHKLDLPRVYYKDEYKRSRSGYDGTPQHGTGNVFIEASDAQQGALHQLEHHARLLLKATGDEIVFSDRGVAATTYQEPQFIACNSNIESCLNACQSAHIDALKRRIAPVKYNLEEIVKAIRCSDDDEFIAKLAEIPSNMLFPEFDQGAYADSPLYYAVQHDKSVYAEHLLELCPQAQKNDYIHAVLVHALCRKVKGLIPRMLKMVDLERLPSAKQSRLIEGAISRNADTKLLVSMFTKLNDINKLTLGWGNKGPLHYSIQCHNIMALYVLLEKTKPLQADLDEALLLVISRGTNDYLVHLLIRKGACVSGEHISECIKQRMGVNTLSLLLDKQKDTLSDRQIEQLIENFSHYPISLPYLRFVLQFESRFISKKFIERLFTAVLQSSNHESVELLINYMPFTSLNKKYPELDGKSCITYCVVRSSWQKCRLLLKQGVDLNTADHEKHIPLWYAIENNAPEDIIENMFTMTGPDLLFNTDFKGNSLLSLALQLPESAGRNTAIEQLIKRLLHLPEGNLHAKCQLLLLRNDHARRYYTIIQRHINSLPVATQFTLLNTIASPYLTNRMILDLARSEKDKLKSFLSYPKAPSVFLKFLGCDELISQSSLMVKTMLAALVEAISAADFLNLKITDLAFRNALNSLAEKDLIEVTTAFIDRLHSMRPSPTAITKLTQLLTAVSQYDRFNPAKKAIVIAMFNRSRSLLATSAGSEAHKQHIQLCYTIVSAYFSKHYIPIMKREVESIFKIVSSPTTVQQLSAMIAYINTGKNRGHITELKRAISDVRSSGSPVEHCDSRFRSLMLAQKSRWTLGGLFSPGIKTNWTQRYRLADDYVLSKTLKPMPG